MTSKEKNNIEDYGGIFTTLRKPHNLWLLFGGISIFLLALFGGGNIESGIGQLLQNLGIELAFAIFIAVFLSVSIEEFTRRQFHSEMDSRIKEIQQNVFRSTYSRDLPDPFFNEVEQQLFQCKFSYSNYFATYNFNWSQLPTESSNSRVLDVRIKHQFTVRNLTAFASEHSIYLHIQELPDLSDVKCPKIISVILSGSGTFKPEKIEEVNRNSVIVDMTRTFKIQTDDIPPGGILDVDIVAQSTKNADGFVFCRCSEPTRKLTVTATFPHDIPPSLVGADSAHRTRCGLTRHDSNSNEFTWVMADTILPYQGLNFWWASGLAKISEIEVNQ